MRYLAPLIATLTLGLAPFVPEPHVLGKLRWVAGGARGMGAVDWFDLVLHGAPWVWLLATIVGDLARYALGAPGSRAGARRRRAAVLAVVAALAGAALCVLWAVGR